MLSTDAALPAPTSLVRIMPGAGTTTGSTAPGGLTTAGAASDAAGSPEIPNFAHLLGLEMPSAPADRGAPPAPALLTLQPELTLTPAAQLPEAAAPEAAGLLQEGGKPGKAAGKTLPIAVPPLPAPDMIDAQADADGVEAGDFRLPAPASQDKSAPAVMELALPAILTVAAPLSLPVEAIAAPTAETSAAPRALPVSFAAEPGLAPASAPETKSRSGRQQPVTVESGPGAAILPAALQAAPPPAVSAPAVLARALASLRVLADDKSATDLPSSASGRAPAAPPVAAIQPAASLQVPVPAMPSDAQPPAAPLTGQPAPARLAARPGKDAPEPPQIVVAPASTDAPALQSAARDPLAPLASPALPSLAADLVMAVQGPAAPAPAQVVRAAAQPLAAGTDFAGLIDRLVEARDAASLQSGGAATIGATLAHAEFGRVSMQFRQDDGALSVSMASNDPGFASAVQMAAAGPGAGLNEDRAATARQDQQQAGASGNPSAERSAGGSSAQSQSQSQNQSQTQSQAQAQSQQGQPQPAWPRGGGQAGTDEEQRAPVAEPRQADGSIYV